MLQKHFQSFSLKHLLFLILSLSFLLSQVSSIKLNQQSIPNKIISSSNEDSILLKEDNPYYKFIQEENKDSFLLRLSDYSKFLWVTIELMTLTGETDLNIVTPVSYTYNKYTSSNKVIFTLVPSSPTGPFPDATFEVNSLNQSYYSIIYHVVPDDERKNIYNIDSGINYLQTIEAKVGNNITVILKNENKEQKLPYLVNFLSMNCDFSVVRSDKKELDIIDYYGQQIIKENDSYYEEEKYSYEVTVESIDSSKQYEGEKCFFYITGVEIQENKLEEKKQILISENIEQDIIFKDDLKSIKYLYPHANADESINIHFDLKEQAVYNVRFYFNGVLSGKTYEISRDQHIYLSKEDSTWEKQCDSLEKECNITTEIILTKTFEEENPTLLMFIKKIPSFPSYLVKSEMLSDFLNGNNYQYYYTDIGLNDEGNILVNFQRGSGKVFTRIVKINLDKPEDKPNWKGLYRFPQSSQDSLIYDSFTKKIYYSPEDTMNCQSGCFLLITIVSSIETSRTEEYIPVPFTIMIHSNPPNIPSKEIPIIRVPLEEFVLGNISPGRDDIKEFYSIWLDSDAEEVIIDWQTTSAGIYINAGSTRPSRYNTNFIHYSSGKDSIFVMSKEDIIKRSGEKDRKTIKNMVLTIGVDTSKVGEVYTSIYKFKFRLKKKEINIYQVNSDQKVLCKSEKTDSGKYRCLYAVLCSSIDIENNLIVYPVSQKDNVELEAYADLVSYQNYEQWNTEYLIEHIPNDKSKYMTEGTGLDFLYIPNGVQDNHFYIAVYSNEEVIMEMSTSFFTYESSIYPNPSTVQLFSFKKESVAFHFIADNLFQISIESLAGKAKLYWSHDANSTFYLNDNKDKIRLVLNPQDCLSESCSLVIENRDTKASSTEPGFTFSISYNVKSYAIDDMIFDEMLYGQSVKLAYKNIRFPILLYSSIQNISNPIDVNLDFYDMEQNGHPIPSLKDTAFDIQAMVINSEEMDMIKSDPTFVKVDKNSVSGVFNSGLSSANIFLSSDALAKFQVYNNGFLFIYITKSKEVSDTLFNKLTLGASVSTLNGDYFSAEKIYHYGKLDSEYRNIFKLRYNYKYKYMRIEYATNNNDNELMGWSLRTKVDDINYQKNETESIEFSKDEWINGRGLLTIRTSQDIYLNVFIKKKNYDPQLTNFVYKYIYADKLEDIKEYRVEDDKIQFYQSNSSISFNKIDFNDLSSNATIEYYIKVINDKEHIQGEVINTVAIGNSNGASSYYLDKKKNEKGKIYLDLSNMSINNKYLVNVIAKIVDGSVCEYIAYQGLNIEIKQTIEEDDGDLAVFFIVFAVFFVIVVVILVFFLLKCRKDNMNLMEQVRQTSFKGNSTDVLVDKDNK